MKKSNLILITIIGFAILSSMLPFIFPGSIFDPSVSSSGILLNIMIYLGLFVIGVYFKFEESGISSKEISFIAIYSAFVSISRIPFVGIPSVQPVTYLVFCAGYVFGPLIGFIIGGNVALVSNIFLGQGMWTIYQIFGWGIVGIIGGFLGHRKVKEKSPNKWILSLLGILLGFIYGWITNTWQWLMIKPVTIQSFFLVNLASVYFDASHAVANFVFLYFFGTKTINILYRYRSRFKTIINVEIIRPDLGIKR